MGTFSTGILIVLVALSSFAVADDCMEHARSAMEESYCHVKASRYGGRLPSLYHFRKNDEKTQRLLLGKPAQRAGVSLPPQQPATAPKPPAAQRPPQTARPPIPAPPSRAPAASSPSLANCQLQRQQIECPQGVFYLLNNKDNAHLPLGALDDSNRLLLPRRQQRAYSRYSDTQYLSALYKIYLEKMLQIGLAAATMSYTKFVATYQLHLSEHIDPHQRFAAMYELLKKERKSNSVKSRYNDHLPHDIDQCMAANEFLIVCDDVQNNWVFSK